MGPMLLARRVLLVLCFFSLTVLAAPKPEFKIRSIKFIGSKHYSQEHLVKALGLKVGDTFDQSVLAQAAERLSAAGVFSSLEYKFGPSGDGLGIEVTVTDSVSYLPAVFDNFVWWTPSELTKLLQERQPLFDGSVPEDGAMLDEITGILGDLLRASNIVSTVSYKLQTDPNDTAKLKAMLFVADDVHLPISRLQINGADHAPAGSVDAAIKPLIGDDYRISLVQTMLAGRLGPAYSRIGYLKMQVGMPEATLEADRVAATVPVEEGLQYKAKNVEWSGDTAQGGPGAFAAVHLKQGEIVDGEQLKADLDKVRQQYGSHGYMESHIEPETTFDDSAATVSYKFDVRAGKQFLMGNFEILGMDQFSEAELKQLWKLPTGQPYDTTYLGTYIRQELSKVPATAGHKLESTLAPRDGNIIDVTLSFEDIPRIRERQGGRTP